MGQFFTVEYFIRFSLVIIGVLGMFVYYLLPSETSPRERVIESIPFFVSFMALWLAAISFQESSKDSMILQEQLAELKKISEILGSK